MTYLKRGQLLKAIKTSFISSYTSIVASDGYIISFRRIWNYPIGQNDSLELIFKKFATAKNRKKLNPLKVSSNRCYLPENNNDVV